ncbi:MAG: sulfotransferase domain-containing protein [Cyclobacteriaceae bacterium]
MRSELPDCVIHDNVYVFAQHRGGSTWIAEILNQIPESAVITEPLWRGKFLTNGELPLQSVGKCDEIRELDFYYQQPIPEGAEWPEAEEFFRRLFKLEVCKLGLYLDHKFSHLKSYKSFIFKFCFGNQLMPWLVQKFNIKAILLVRHPCAVVQSQMQMPYWDLVRRHPEFKVTDFRYNEVYLKYEHVLRQIKTPEENLAAHWCFNMLATLKDPNNNKKWLTVAYENLYENYDQEIDRIFQWIDRPIAQRVGSLNFKPSRYTESYSLEYIKSGNQLNIWKERLDKDQIKRILQIVEAFEIDGYSDNVLPDLKAIYGSS